MKWFRAVWPLREPAKKLDEVQQRLDSVTDDDVKVEELVERAQQLLRENHLAPAIIRALRL